MKKNLSEIASIISGSVIGDETTEICGLTNYLNPQKGCITFIEDQALLPQLESSQIAAIILPESASTSQKPYITVKNPKLAFAKLMQAFFPPRRFSGKISHKASVADTAVIGENVTIEDFVVIGNNVTIGDNTTIRSFSYIDVDSVIGKNCLIHPNVVIYDKTQIGDGVLIHSSCVIGADGFGFVKDSSGKQLKVPQVGNVILEDDVELGSNVSIDRATFGSTILRKRVKIDNLVQIAHNVVIDEDTVVSGHAGIAGSAQIGKRCTVAAATGIGDHAILEDNVTVAGKSGVASNKILKSHKVYVGVPARPYEKFRETQGMLARLPYIISDVKKMKLKIEELEKLGQTKDPA